MHGVFMFAYTFCFLGFYVFRNVDTDYSYHSWLGIIHLVLFWLNLMNHMFIVANKWESSSEIAIMSHSQRYSCE